jgi:hypothetical protein
VTKKFLALRQSVAELHDEDGKEVGSITTTAGLGGDAVFLEWNGRVGVVRMSQLLREWVKSFDASGARRLPVVGPPEIVGRTTPAQPDGDKPRGNLAAEVERKMGGRDASG